ncbi:hypothetical protein ACFORH_07920 [Amycolatopsis roodepoortensis]|uniref:Asp/Glu racemase n=1 Tax=Amycolatopsis roodepoortensis TaxID=700274 RepID=A0ABR9L8R5_9PSEU|nr:hypothetical protein [Amycolatopsis roodepoortensis]MBE1577088.1 hypothetical protein [Amycolatopsis roodepoortensis]
MSPRIALISATPAAIPPAVSALESGFPQARPWNILDDRLLADGGEDGRTPALDDRMRRLIEYAVAGGADGVLLTCSLYGEITKQVEAPVPLLAPDEAAFDDALAGGHDRILVVASLAAALSDSTARFEQAARDKGVDVEVGGLLAPGRLVESCQAQGRGWDLVLLAQYSLAPAADELSSALGVPVVSGPRSAAARLKAVIGG